MSGGLRAPRTPCGRVADPAPASVCFADLARGDNGVQHYMTTVTFFTVCDTTSAFFFVRYDSRRSTPGGCFPQTSLPATDRVRFNDMGDFAEPFPPPLRELFRPRRSSAPSRPARGCAPLDPRQGAPCTCPASPFMAKPGLSFTHRLAVEKSMLYPHWEQSVMGKVAGQEKRNNGACVRLFRRHGDHALLWCPVTRIERLSALFHRTLASADELPLAPVVGGEGVRHAGRGGGGER